MEDFSLHQRCLVHGGGFPAAMLPAIDNANFQIVQAPGFVAITYELIHDIRTILLREHGWNISKTGELIATLRSTLYKKIEQYRISEETDG